MDNLYSNSQMFPDGFQLAPREEEPEPAPTGPRVVVAQVNTSGPPQAVIQVTGLPEGTLFDVRRSTNGRDWTRVRGSSQPMPEAGPVIINDWSAPTGSEVFYRIFADGLPIARSASIQIATGGMAWLQDGFNPQHGIAIRIESLDAGSGLWGLDALRNASWTQPVSSARVMGSSLPVDSIGVRSRAGQVPVVIHTLVSTDSNSLRDLFLQAGPLLLRGAPCEMLNNEFIVIPDISELHLGNPHELATFTGTASVTREPSSAIRIPFWTWQQAEDSVEIKRPGSTYEDVHGMTGDATYADVQADPGLLTNPRSRPMT